MVEHKQTQTTWCVMTHTRCAAALLSECRHVYGRRCEAASSPDSSPAVHPDDTEVMHDARHHDHHVEDLVRRPYEICKTSRRHAWRRRWWWRTPGNAATG